MLKPRTVLLILPSLRISGGNAEALRLARGLQSRGVHVHITVMWQAPLELEADDFVVTHLCTAPPEASRAFLQLPQIVWHFRLLVRSLRKTNGQLTLLLTHFSTFLFAWLVSKAQFLCFIQALEWLFVAEGWKRSALKRFILATSRRSIVITTNQYLTSCFRQEGIQPIGEFAIWPNREWLYSGPLLVRDIDIVMVLRISAIKRLDLGLEFLDKIRQHGRLKTAIITPDEKIIPQLRERGIEFLFQPSKEEMRHIYARSRLYVLLSDVEGFGLPPLEAMACGCIPFCRDCGGVRTYMKGPFASLLRSKDESIDSLVSHAISLLSGSLPTPSEAVAAFERGLDESEYRREHMLDTLVSLITAGFKHR